MMEEEDEELQKFHNWVREVIVRKNNFFFFSLILLPQVPLEIMSFLFFEFSIFISSSKDLH